MKNKSVWIASLIHYLVAGLIPIGLVVLVLKLIYNPDLFAATVHNHFIAAIIFIVIFFLVSWVLAKISAKVLSKYSGRKIIIILSSIFLGLTVYIAQVWAFWTVQNSLPGYAQVPVSFPEPYLTPIQPTIIILIVFIVCSFLSLKKD